MKSPTTSSLRLLADLGLADGRQLRAWVAAGYELGDHTWDHPCLDRADEREQHRQIMDAHTWLLKAKLDRSE